MSSWVRGNGKSLGHAAIEAATNIPVNLGLGSRDYG